MTAKGPHFRLEAQLRRKGVWPIAGVDEVGRGPLAGPVAAAAVILDPERRPRGLDDSKVLNQAQREEAFERIMASALAVSVAFVAPAEIDRINIRQATLAAMARAVAGLAQTPAYLLIDGNDRPPVNCASPSTIRTMVLRRMSATPCSVTSTRWRCTARARRTASASRPCVRRDA
ncbi:MAG: rnhB [Methylocystaceae bacterium]|nr:MAG: rnhB [Methylocystaceae bacterium]